MRHKKLVDSNITLVKKMPAYLQGQIERKFSI